MFFGWPFIFFFHRYRNDQKNALPIQTRTMWQSYVDDGFDPLPELFVCKQIRLNETDYFFGGFDARHNKSSEPVVDIHQNHHKWMLLRLLQDKGISIIEKINALEKENPASYKLNITNGGLFKDWFLDI
jgi:hypothetical protein